MAYVLLMALLMFGLLERRVREAMKHKSEPLIIPGKVKPFRSTGNPNRRAFGSRFKMPGVLELAGFSPGIYLDIKGQNEFLCFRVLQTRYMERWKNIGKENFYVN
ncbi:MAG: hypothetical protein R6U91_10015 [Bacillota bacterium]